MHSPDGVEICAIHLPICDHQLLRRAGLSLLGLFYFAEAAARDFRFLSFDRGLGSLVFLVVRPWKPVRDQAAVFDLENGVGELSGLVYAYLVSALVSYVSRRERGVKYNLG